MSLVELPSVGLVEAALDPELLGTLEFWPLQLDLLAAIEEGPELHVVNWGRRGSKTTLAALVGVHACTLRPELRSRLRRRERGWAVGVATNQRQARIFVDAARNLVMDSPLLASIVESQSQDEILFANGMGLVAFPCTARSGRGWPIHTLVFDEFAQHIDTDGGSHADDVWAALTPSTAQFGGMERVLVISTPAGRQGKFFDLFTGASAGTLPGAKAHHATTRQVSPMVSDEFLERQRVLLGEDVYRAEYEAEFTAGGGLLFSREELEAVSVPQLVEVDDGAGWVAGLDPSSGGGDAFALAIVGRDMRPGYEGRLLAGHLQRWVPRRGVKPSKRTRFERELWVDEVLDGVAGPVLRFAAAAVSDAHVPGVVADELAKRGVRQVRVTPWTTQTRMAAFQALRARIATERITLPADDDLLAELGRVQTRFRGGGPVITIARQGDSHGDLAMALALAVYELDSRGVSLRRARLSRPVLREEGAYAPWGPAGRV